MNILVISPDYPDEKRSRYPFVKQLVNQFALMGHHCCVIAPYSITRNKSFSAQRESYKVSANGQVIVLRPNYISISKLKIGSYNISKLLYEKALKRGLKKIPFAPDIVYSHFWSSGWAAYKFARENNIPLFVATGESSIKDMFEIHKEQKAFFDYVRGVICVSSKNRDESIALGLTTLDKCGLFPNAVDSKLFRKYDRSECRKLLGLPQDAFIVAFVGWFIERKGSDRVAEAVSRCKDVNSIFIGSGDRSPHVRGVLFQGTLPHNQVPVYLGASDVFVLPTLHEGCCNAVIEAMSCGLPVISSNLPFNWDVLDETNSIMIDPNNIDDIADAIKKLQHDIVLRKHLSDGALKRASSLTIDQRADAILNFINSKMK